MLARGKKSWDFLGITRLQRGRPKPVGMTPRVSMTHVRPWWGMGSMSLQWPCSLAIGATVVGCGPASLIGLRWWPHFVLGPTQP